MKIIRGAMDGYGIGMLTIRDIRNDPFARAIYGCDFLIIDGGHRCRALTKFYLGKVKVDGLLFNQTDFDPANVQVPVMICECTAHEASVMFKNINTTTPTNFMEMIMSDEESEVCKAIRSTTMYVKEYNNEVHPLFETRIKANGKRTIENWDGDNPNPRRKWDEYVAIAIIRSLTKSLSNAGQTDIERLCTKDKVSKKALERVNDFLNCVVDLRDNRGRTINGDYFGAFCVYYFGLLGKYGNFSIDHDNFYTNFKNAYVRLTGKIDKSFDDVDVEFNGERIPMKQFCRANVKNYANGEAQSKLFEIFDDLITEKHITVLDDKRSITLAEREEALVLQGGVCAIDGLPLDLNDSVFGHDTPWCKGGRSELANGAIIRRQHNRDMGVMTLDQYRMFLKMEAAA